MTDAPHEPWPHLDHVGVGEGRIEVICGPMFSGKTEELQRRVRRARIAHQPTLIVKPAIDKRYAEKAVVTHDENALAAEPVDNTAGLSALLSARDRPITVLAIDEVQFFDTNLPSLCSHLADQGVRVIAAGLDLDFTGQPFGCMPELLARAEEVTKLHAVCMETGRPAHFSHRIAGSDATVELGAKDRYIPLTRQAFVAARSGDKPPAVE